MHPRLTKLAEEPEMMAENKLESSSGIRSFRAAGKPARKEQPCPFRPSPPNPNAVASALAPVHHVQPTPDTGLSPPIIPPANCPMTPMLEEPEDVPAHTQETPAPRPPRLGQPPRGKRLARPPDSAPLHLTAEQRLLLLDTWRRSGLPAGDFAALVGLDVPDIAKGQAPKPFGPRMCHY